MVAHPFPARVPQGRNLAIFWAVTLEGRAQGELAGEYGISQQRVSQIVRATRRFIALATSEQYEDVPQRAQLQLGCRIQLERLSRRRRAVALAFEASTRPKTSVKRVTGASGERIETVEKSQYGDWRLDRQLGEIDKQLLDTRVLLYERPWWGREEMTKDQIPMTNRGMRNPELGMPTGEEVVSANGRGEADGGVVVPGTEYSVLSTDDAALPVAEASNAPLVATEPVPETAVPQSAIEPSAIEPVAIEPATPPKRLWRKDPVCDLTGRWINPPTDAHRPWRRVFLPRERFPPAPIDSKDTPQGVLLDSRQNLANQSWQGSEDVGVTDSGESPWEEIERRLQERFQSAELLAAP